MGGRAGVKMQRIGGSNRGIERHHFCPIPTASVGGGKEQGYGFFAPLSAEERTCVGLCHPVANQLLAQSIHRRLARLGLSTVERSTDQVTQRKTGLMAYGMEGRGNAAWCGEG